MQLAVNSGAVLKSSVSGKTDFLIAGTQESGGTSSKEKKARELNNTGKAKIQILNESEFLQLVKKEGSVV